MLKMLSAIQRSFFNLQFVCNTTCSVTFVPYVPKSDLILCTVHICCISSLIMDKWQSLKCSGHVTHLIITLLITDQGPVIFKIPFNVRFTMNLLYPTFHLQINFATALLFIFTAMLQRWNRSTLNFLLENSICKYLDSTCFYF